jgi:3-deoxy-D-manno-octulosonate 8-phosphate phosphatase (KDO 8-P phosphatase)
MKEHLPAGRLANIKLLLMDCDGVLTDGRLYFTSNGEELKVFHVRDGQGLAEWHKAGFESGIISGRNSESIVRRRADELGIRFLKTGSSDKAADLQEILSVSGVSAEETAFVGDDVGDIEIMKCVGIAVAVGDAHGSLREVADHVTIKSGGHGAIREVVDLLLEARK